MINKKTDSVKISVINKKTDSVKISVINKKTDSVKIQLSPVKMKSVIMKNYIEQIIYPHQLPWVYVKSSYIEVCLIWKYLMSP